VLGEFSLQLLYGELEGSVDGTIHPQFMIARIDVGNWAMIAVVGLGGGYKARRVVRI
jgi:hypothetical protein